METLGQKQRRFAGYVSQLIQQAEAMGFEVAGGEWSRSDEQAVINSLGSDGREHLAALIQSSYPDLAQCIRNNGKNNGIRLSVHQLGLALDLKLFKDGVYLTSSEDYRELGDWWKTLAPDCRWGGDFPGDGNHFSIEHNGVK